MTTSASQAEGAFVNAPEYVPAKSANADKLENLVGISVE
jgi:hypothetical protein